MKPHWLTVLLVTVSMLAGQTRPGENLEVSGIPAIPETLVGRTTQYLNVRSAELLDWEAVGEGIYISTRFGNTVQVHYIARPGATRQQLTFFDEPVSTASADPRPGKQGFLFSRDVGGSEFYQIFYFDRTNGQQRLLTDGKSLNSIGLWSNSGRQFCYYSNRRNGKDFDVWIMDPDSPDAAKTATKREGAWFPVDWSPDDTRLLVVQYVSASESHPYIVDLENGELRSLEASSPTPIFYSNLAWSRDGESIYYVSNEGGDFQSLYRFEVETGKRVRLLEESQWDVENLALSRDGRFLALTLNEGGISKLRVLELPALKELEVRGVPVGVISDLRFNRRASALAMTLNAATGPRDVYAVDLNTRQLQKWTSSEVGGLDPGSFVSPVVANFPTFDQEEGAPRMIPAFVYKPVKDPGRHPVIIDIHGGPEGQARPEFSSLYQFWLNELGCAVVVPNVRGSTGYGKIYEQLDNGFRREDAVKDIGALLDWIARQPDLDPHRVAVFGGSYGGYMVLASLATYPDRLRCGIDMVGISNFVTFLENTEDYRRDLRRVEYGDERDAEMRQFLERISPLNNAGRIRSPLLVAQGENDPRVPASEGRQIVAALEKNGIQVWTIFAKDEGHGFRKKNNRDYFMRAAVLFLQEFLLK